MRRTKRFGSVAVFSVGVIGLRRERNWDHRVSATMGAPDFECSTKRAFAMCAMNLRDMKCVLANLVHYIQVWEGDLVYLHKVTEHGYSAGLSE